MSPGPHTSPSSMLDAHERWSAANQRRLMQAVEEVLGFLTRHASTRVAAVAAPSPEGDGLLDGGGPSGAEPEPEAPDAPPAAIDSLCETFGLTRFERAILLCCAGVELSSRFAAACAAAQEDARHACPTFALALAAFPDPHWSALLPSSPLRRWRLVEMSGSESLVRGRLRIDERVLHHLTGLPCLDPRLVELTVPVGVDAETISPSRARAVERLVSLWSSKDRSTSPGPIHLGGAEPAALRAIAAAASARLGLRLHALPAAHVPAGAGERDALATLWDRETALDGRALLIECDEADAPELSRAVDLALRLRGPSALASRDPPRLGDAAAARVEVPPLEPREIEALWREKLGPLGGRANGALARVSWQYRLRPGAIGAVALLARERAAQESEDLERALWELCREHARTALEGLAQRLEPRATWEDLVLPPVQLQTLREIAAGVRHRAQVLEGWGFGRRGARGRGVTALFAGASGTGKTLAAEVLAGELRLDLYRIDLSQVVSKYIGETEKNLRRVFSAAEEGGAVLLFDEADALFGKRTEVKDSHDRYANIEVSYLLQRMEAYGGLAILTTNARAALDTAFLRRLSFAVQFPFPDVPQREEIWRRMFPEGAPTDGLDLGRLSRLALAGGNIRSIVLNAAFLAADAGEPIRMSHLLRSVRSEYAKLEKPLSEADLGGWA